MELEMHACRIVAEHKIAAAQQEVNASAIATETANTSRLRAELQASENRRTRHLRSELQAQVAGACGPAASPPPPSSLKCCH
eukprot:12820791-Prorocentrum_lima.AAC.1